jgi:hypothetical protein
MRKTTCASPHGTVGVDLQDLIDDTIGRVL